MVETKSKTKLVKLLGSVILGLVFLCMCFVGLGISINKNAKAEGEELASIYVDSGATTNITGGSVGAMESGNSVYVADGGTLNVTGGTVSGNIYNGGTLNYTAGTLNSVTLASGKYITFKGNPSSTITITLDSPSVGTNIGYLDGITSVTLSRFSVTNLPANTELRISGSYITIAYVDRTVSFAVDPSGYGTVSQSTLTLPHGSSVSVSGSTLSYGSTSITATPASQTAQYTYSFDGWYVGNTQITSSRTITANTTITARFTRTTRTYTVTITRNYTSYGTVSRSSVTGVPYGTVLSTSSNTLNVNGTTVTATPTTASPQYSYSFSSWTNGTETVTGNLTVTANFSRSTRGYWVYAYARYSTSSSGTNSGATAGITGGTASITYNSSTSTTSGTSSVNKYVSYGSSVTLSASAKGGYAFVGWYSSTTSTTALSTSSRYSPTITGTSYYYAFFRATTYTVTISRNNTSYGTVSTSSVSNVPYGATIRVGSSANTLSVNGTTVTATPATNTSSYTYSFSKWTLTSTTGTQITTSGIIVTGNTTIYANFTRTSTSTPTYYTVTITAGSGGTVSETSVSVASGTTFSTSGNKLTIGGTTIYAYANSNYLFSYWSPSSGTITGNTTIRAYFTYNQPDPDPDPDPDPPEPSGDISQRIQDRGYISVGLQDGYTPTLEEMMLVEMLHKYYFEGGTLDNIFEGVYQHAIGNPGYMSDWFTMFTSGVYGTIDYYNDINDGYSALHGGEIDIYFGFDSYYDLASEFLGEDYSRFSFSRPKMYYLMYDDGVDDHNGDLDYLNVTYGRALIITSPYENLSVLEHFLTNHYSWQVDMFTIDLDASEYYQLLDQLIDNGFEYDAIFFSSQFAGETYLERLHTVLNDIAWGTNDLYTFTYAWVNGANYINEFIDYVNNNSDNYVDGEIYTSISDIFYKFGINDKVAIIPLGIDQGYEDVVEYFTYLMRSRVYSSPFNVHDYIRGESGEEEEIFPDGW